MENITLFSYQIQILGFGFSVGIIGAMIVWLIKVLAVNKVNFAITLSILLTFLYQNLVQFLMVLHWHELYLDEKFDFTAGIVMGFLAIASICYLNRPQSDNEFIEELLEIKSSQPKCKFDDLNIRTLRSLASLGKVKYYCSKRKNELIEALENK